MMKVKLLFGALFFFWMTASAQPGTDTTSTGVDSIMHRLILVGDAGELKGTTHPVVEWLRKNVNFNDERNTVIYLGDNIYPEGLPMEGESTYPEAKRIIDYQIDLVRDKKAKAFFIPGNHDWKIG